MKINHPSDSAPPDTAGPAGTRTEKPKPLFDCEEVFKKEILPLAERLHALCVEHKLPALVAICYTAKAEQFHGLFTRSNHDGWMPGQYAMASRILDKPTDAFSFGGMVPLPPGAGLALLAALAGALGGEGGDDDTKSPAEPTPPPSSL